MMTIVTEIFSELFKLLKLTISVGCGVACDTLTEKFFLNVRTLKLKITFGIYTALFKERFQLKQRRV
jgi:hypothetical protein